MSTEEFKINGEDLVAKVKELIHEGNIHSAAAALLAKCTIVVEKK